MKSSFRFYKKLSDIKEKEAAFIVRIPKGLTTREELFDVYAIHEHFPLYFGRNWDALYDCLTDREWMPSETLILLHQDLPFAHAPDIRQAYLALLKDISEEPDIRVLFPQSCRGEMEGYDGD